MPQDLLLTYQQLTTKSAAFASAAITLPTGTPKNKPASIWIQYSAASVSSGTGSAVFVIQVSEDSGSTFNTIAQLEPIALSSTATSGEAYLPFTHSPGHNPANLPQYRLNLVTLSGTSPTITYQAAQAAAGASIGF